jgi:hypothetical protein
MDIFIGLSSDSETINTLEETESGSDSDSSSILSSSVTVTEGSSVESKDKSDEDIETKIDNVFLNN